MAVMLSSESQKRHSSFTTVLASALLEWMLIFMLLVYGLFGYLITKFARYSELPLPCLLCSRIDHILGSEKAGFYWDMICGNHKLEISSLVYCHFHERLVDVRGMCESCLFSFATKNKSNAETYRLLVGKLGGEDLSGFDDDPVTNDHKIKGLDMKRCCCCNELFTSRHHAQTLLQTKSSGFDGSNLDLPLSREFSQDCNDLEKELKSSNSSTDIGRKNENSLVQVGYSELKVTSDTESDIQMSDAEDTRPLISTDPLRDLIIDSAPLNSFIAVSEDESANQDVLLSEPSEILPMVQADIIDLHDAPSAAPASAVGHGLEELDWQEIDINLDPSASTSLMTSNNVSESPNDENVSVHSSKDRSNIEVGIVPDKVDVKDLKNLDIKESGSVMEKMDVKDSNNLDIIEGGVVTEKVDVKDSKKMSVKEAGVVQTLKQMTEKSEELECLQTTTDVNNMNMNMKSERKERGLQIPGLQIPNYLDLGDAYNLAINGKSRQLSGKLAEQLVGKESPTLNPDLKLLLSHLSKGSEFLSSDILSPGLSKNVDELKANNDSSTSIGMKILQKRISLERNDSKSSLDRNESGIESLDFSTVSEIEGESEVDRLKRQLEHNRKFLIALLKDLEEERNASSIAANETMAMITRLQEEKAALQMEASHDLRMMEEQAEYDLEALDKLNEIVIEKEKKIQDLEADLEYYRIKYQNDSNMENDGESASNACLSGTDDLNGLAENTKSKSKDPLLEIEDERKHISECLNNLEKKLSAFCCNRIHPDWKHSDLKLPEEDQVKSDCDENVLLSDKVGFIPTGSHKTLLRHAYSFKRSKSAGAEQTALILKEADIVALVNEVSSLSMKLEALEADQSFIERSINTLKNGEEGLIQEIASHLRELRKIGVRRHEERSPVER